MKKLLSITLVIIFLSITILYALPGACEINSPTEGNYDGKRINFNITLEEEAGYIKYIDYDDRIPRNRTLCRRCSEYGSTRTRASTFREGFHNISIYAANDLCKDSLIFFVDSKKPRITAQLPRNGGYTNGHFNVTYNEDYLETVSLYIAEEGSEVYELAAIEDDCPSGRGQECEIVVDGIEELEGQTISYYFNISDLFRSDVSRRAYSVVVDTTPPEITINSFEKISESYERYSLDISLSEQVKLLEYFYEGPSMPIRLCSSCDSKTTTLYFRTIPDKINFTAKDYAGNVGEVSINGEIPVNDTNNTISLPFERLYSSNSPFYQKISENPEIDPSSDLMIESLKAAGQDNTIIIATTHWTPTLFYANETTPKYDVELTAPWSPYNRILNVPIPTNAIQEPSDDGSMVIIDLSTGYEYDFWQAKKVGGNWQASWANRLPINSTGIFEKGLSARGSGFALPAGLIWPEELENGSIEHALFFTYSFTKANGPVLPATESDGGSNRADAIPEGAIIQLDPNLDLNTLSLTPTEKIIAKAMQKYGMILGDTGGGIELEVINPLSYAADPYTEFFPERDAEGLAYITGIPFDSFRVLKLPGQYQPEVDVMEPWIYD